MPGRFLEIPVFLGDYFIMPHPACRPTYLVSATKLSLARHGDIYPLISTFTRIQVARPRYLYPATYMYLV